MGRKKKKNNETATNINNDNNTEDSEWTTVIDVKKVKRKAKYAKKKAENKQKEMEGEKKLASTIYDILDETSNDNNDSNKQNHDEKERKDNSKSNDVSKRKKSNKRNKNNSSNNHSKPKNVESMIKLVKGIIQSEPSKLQVSAIGDRVQAMTQASWSQAYKSKFGRLKGFLNRHFYVDNEDYVSITAPKKAGSNKKSKSKSTNINGNMKKKPVKKTQLQHTTNNNNNNNNNKQSKEGNTCANFSFVVILFIGVMLLTLAVIDSNHLKQLYSSVLNEVEKIQQKLK